MQAAFHESNPVLCVQTCVRVCCHKTYVACSNSNDATGSSKDKEPEPLQSEVVIVVSFFKWLQAASDGSSTVHPRMSASSKADIHKVPALCSFAASFEVLSMLPNNGLDRHDGLTPYVCL